MSFLLAAALTCAKCDQEWLACRKEAIRQHVPEFIAVHVCLDVYMKCHKREKCQ